MALPEEYRQHRIFDLYHGVEAESLGQVASPLQVPLGASGAVLSLEAQAVSALLATRRPDIVPLGSSY